MVELDCDLDAAGVTSCKSLFERMAEDGSDIVIDMRKVSVIDGSGLGAILHVMKRKNAMGGRLGVVNVVGQPRELLKTLKVLPLIEHLGEVEILDAQDRAAIPAEIRVGTIATHR